MSLHVAIEDRDSPDEPEGMFDCKRCGEPTWHDLCDNCWVLSEKDKAAGDG